MFFFAYGGSGGHHSQLGAGKQLQLESRELLGVFGLASKAQHAQLEGRGVRLLEQIAAAAPILRAAKVHATPPPCRRSDGADQRRAVV